MKAKCARVVVRSAAGRSKQVCRFCCNSCTNIHFNSNLNLLYLKEIQWSSGFARTSSPQPLGTSVVPTNNLHAFLTFVGSHKQGCVSVTVLECEGGGLEGAQRPRKCFRPPHKSTIHSSCAVTGTLVFVRTYPSVQQANRFLAFMHLYLSHKQSSTIEKRLLLSAGSSNFVLTPV